MLVGSGATEAFSLTFTNAGASIYAFNAFVTKFEVAGMEEDENLTAEMSLKITGMPVLTV